MTPKSDKKGQMTFTKNGILYFTEYQISRKDGMQGLTFILTVL
jgi:hypothetical protein